MTIGSEMMLATLMRGFNEEYGSWKIICMRRRKARSLRPLTSLRTVPSKVTVPSVGRYSCRIARPVVDLPQPDSPTRPSVSPSRTKNEIPSTAFTSAILRWKRIPEVTGKYIFS